MQIEKSSSKKGRDQREIMPLVLQDPGRFWKLLQWVRVKNKAENRWEIYADPQVSLPVHIFIKRVYSQKYYIRKLWALGSRPEWGTKWNIWILIQRLPTELFPCSSWSYLAAWLIDFRRLIVSSQKILRVPKATTSNINIWKFLN